MTKDTKEKKFSLTQQETSNIEIRRSKISDKEYEMNLVKNDLEIYIRSVILARVGKDTNSKFTLSPDSKQIEILGDESYGTEKGPGLPKSTTVSR